MEEQFMRRAISLAEQAKHRGDHPFGAVIACDGKIIGTGSSRELTRHDVTQHAEMQAVSEASRTLASKELPNCVIFASGEPCNMCASAIFQARIPKVYIGARRKDLPHFFRKRDIDITALAKDASYSPEIIIGVLNREAKTLFD